MGGVTDIVLIIQCQLGNIQELLKEMLTCESSWTLNGRYLRPENISEGKTKDTAQMNATFEWWWHLGSDPSGQGQVRTTCQVLQKGDILAELLLDSPFWIPSVDFLGMVDDSKSDIDWAPTVCQTLLCILGLPEATQQTNPCLTLWNLQSSELRSPVTVPSPALQASNVIIS